MVNQKAEAAKKILPCLVTMKAQLRPLDLERLLPLNENERTCLDYYGILLAPEQGQQSVGYFMSEDQRLAGYRFRPAEGVRGSCFILHGYYDHTGIYGNLIRFLLRQGLEVIAFDLPGHGLSSGVRASIEDFEHYRRALEALVETAQDSSLPKPWFAMGQSTGAGILADYLLTHRFNRDNCPFKQVVLFAPLLRPHRWPMGKIAYHLVNPFIGALQRSYSINSSDKDFLEFIRHYDPLQPRTLPVAWVGSMTRWIPRMLNARPSSLTPLIVQGEMDKTVDWKFNVAAYRKLFPQSRFLMIPEAGHQLVNEKEDYRQSYYDWISNQLMDENDSEIRENA